MVATDDQTVQVHDAMWPQRVGIVSDKLYRLWPEDLHGRLGAGTAIAQHPKRFRVTDSGLQVADLDDQKWYTVNGTCECQDYQVAQQGFCKHRTAAHIFQEARQLPAEDLMSEPATVDLTTGKILDAESLDDEPPDSVRDAWQQEQAAERAVLAAETMADADHASRMALLHQVVQATVREVLAGQPPALPEAAFSLCLRGRLDGQDAQVTIRGATAHEFRANLQAVREVLADSRGLLDPLPGPAQPAVSQAELPEDVPTAAEPAAKGPDWCDTCGAPMKWRVGKGESKGWFSHKVGELWCRGKGPGVWVP